MKDYASIRCQGRMRGGARRLNRIPGSPDKTVDWFLRVLAEMERPFIEVDVGMGFETVCRTIGTE